MAKHQLSGWVDPRSSLRAMVEALPADAEVVVESHRSVEPVPLEECPDTAYERRMRPGPDVTLIITIRYRDR